MRNRGSCELRRFRYVGRFGGRETPDTKTESSKETRAASTSDITSCMETHGQTDPHTCRPIAFLLDSADKTALQRCCVLPVRNSHRACQICFFFFSGIVSVRGCYCAPPCAFVFTGAENKMTYWGEGTILYYNEPGTSSGGDL